MKPYFFPFRFLARPILQVIAIVLLLQTTSCTKSTNQSGVNYTGSALLSEAGVHAAAAAGNKILLAGGLVNNVVSKIVDIYDVSSNSWTTALRLNYL